MYVCMYQHISIYIGVTCSRLTLTNGVVVITGTTFGSKATISCLNGFLMTGDKERTCQADGTWSGADASCKSNYTNLILNMCIETFF